MRLYLIFIICLINTGVFAQSTLGGVDSKGMDMNAKPLGYVREIKADAKEVEGTVYLNEEWTIGKIEFVNGSILDNKFIRYNIQSNFFEIKLDAGKVGGSEGRNVKSFELLNSATQEYDKFINSSDFNAGGTKLLGFMREIEIGELSLYAKTDIKLIKANYVAALDMGKEEDAFSKRNVFYIVKNKELIEVVPNKKQFAANFPELEPEILSFIKEENLSLKKEKDLLSLVVFLNNKKV
ncbi:MAG TPA: hypothetical protein PLJ60_14415 [Chryseolinea sp.]|nr:hypothetical protein [Chryseolinea sp.]